MNSFVVSLSVFMCLVLIQQGCFRSNVSWNILMILWWKVWLFFYIGIIFCLHLCNLSSGTSILHQFLASASLLEVWSTKVALITFFYGIVFYHHSDRPLDIYDNIFPFISWFVHMLSRVWFMDMKCHFMLYYVSKWLWNLASPFECPLLTSKHMFKIFNKKYKSLGKCANAVPPNDLTLTVAWTLLGRMVTRFMKNVTRYLMEVVCNQIGLWWLRNQCPSPGLTSTHWH